MLRRKEGKKAKRKEREKIHYDFENKKDTQTDKQMAIMTTTRDRQAGLL